MSFFEVLGPSTDLAVVEEVSEEAAKTAVL